MAGFIDAGKVRGGGGMNLPSYFITKPFLHLLPAYNNNNNNNLINSI